MSDLSLVPIEDLINELMLRGEPCLFAAVLNDQGAPDIKMFYAYENILECLGLIKVLEDDLIEKEKKRVANNDDE